MGTDLVGVAELNLLGLELVRHFEEVTAFDFYRDIFPNGDLDKAYSMTKEKYTGIAVEITKDKKSNGKQIVNRYTVTDDLDVIDRLQFSDNFCVISPISYVGKSRISENARFMYALCIELDNLVFEDDKQKGLEFLIRQWSDKVYWLPKPTYIIASGNGVHLYYVFEKAIPLFRNIVKELSAYKKELTKKLWNRHTTFSYKENDIQYESLFQAFRMVGTKTKNGDRVQAFRVGDRVNIEYMNRYVEKSKITMLYKNSLPLEKAKQKYPEWYENRIVQNKEKGTWFVKRDLYDWWKRRIISEAVVGHRYYCLMCLCIYAIKCNIFYDELESDCFELLKLFEERTDDENNHFTEKDVMDAIQSFEDKALITYPINSISNRSGIHIEKNKRNYRKQEVHLKIARATRDIINDNWREGNGRPKGSGIALEKVLEWRKNNPTGKKANCIRETGLSKPTVYKWWQIN